ncbi:MAG TPA: DUF1559 domain-containing protein [Gemmataceae bacterium]|nr:DUF1559 domain-containing protein [Gemmataceae bacterium]
MTRAVPRLGLLAALLFCACAKKPAPEPEPGPVAPEPGSPGADDKAAREEAKMRLKQIGKAMHEYHDALSFFPAGIAAKGGVVGLSWRVQLLPYLGEESLYKEFKLDEPWDSENNKKLLAKMPKVYTSPGKDGAAGKTYLRSFIGETACIVVPPKGAPKPNLPPGAFARGRRMTDFTDGTSNTLIVVEAAEPVEWTKPDDLPFPGLIGTNPPPAVPKLGSVFPDGFHGLMADGQVYFFPAELKEEVLRALITVNGGEVLGPEVTVKVFEAGRPPKKTVPSDIPDSLPDAAARKKAVENLRAVVKAAHEHHDFVGFLPAGIAGKNAVGLSWRVQVLPHLGPEGTALYKEFKLTEPWDSEHNKELIEKMPAVFASPGKAAPKGHTFLRTTIGPVGMIQTVPGQKGLPPGLQPGQPLRGRPIVHIPDGSSNTILVVEAGEAVPWTKPDELPLTEGLSRKEPPTVPKLGGVFPDGFHAAMADGRVTFYKTGYYERDLFALLTPAGGEPVDPLGDPEKILYSIPWKPVPPPSRPAETKK